jgi:hypothetical protein
MDEEEKRYCVELGETLESGLKRRGGCYHKVRIHYEDEEGEKSLPWTYDPFGKLGWRMPAGSQLKGYDKDEGFYDIATLSESMENAVDYLRSFGKQRGHKVTKVEIDFLDDSEVIPSD